jgi:hypothetical protein
VGVIKAKSIRKFRDNSDKIIGYRLVDQQGHFKDIKSDMLKRMISAGTIEVINLKLTQDNRLIDCAEKPKYAPDELRNLDKFIMSRDLMEVLVYRCDIMYCMKAYFLKEDLTEFEGVIEEAILCESDEEPFEDEGFKLVDMAKEYKKYSNKPILVTIFMNTIRKHIIQTDKINRLYRVFTTMSVKDRVGIPIENWPGQTISMIGYTSTTPEIEVAKLYATGELGYGSEGKVAILDIDVRGPIKCIPLGSNNPNLCEIGLISPKFKVKQKLRDSDKYVIYKAELVS